MPSNLVPGDDKSYADNYIGAARRLPIPVLAVSGSRIVNRGDVGGENAFAASVTNERHKDERLRRVKQPRSSAVTLQTYKVIDGTKGIRGVLSAANITAGEQR